MMMKGADAQLLQFTPWKGNLSRRYAPAVAILRISLLLIFRQRLFWALLALATLAFFFFFYAQYLLVWISQQLAQETIRIAGFPVSVSNLLRFLDRLALNGSAHTYGNFIWFQGYIIVILLAFSGSQLFGNDIVYGSMLFYYSKPISLWHYFYGKCFTIVILLLMTTFIPAVILWIEAGLLFDWKMYYTQNYQLLLGIGGYSALIALTLSLLTAATALLFRRTTPLVLTWMGLFVLLRLISNWLTLATQDANWRLLDLWNNLYLCGLWCFGVDHATIRPVPQPNYGAACLVIVGIIILCLVYINLYLKNLYR
jgi:ABC-type transport system involved in multi-copper enzyme maturation permease subunit